jgi:hypothetical protein
VSGWYVVRRGDAEQIRGGKEVRPDQLSKRRISTQGGARSTSLNACIQLPVSSLEPTPLLRKRSPPSAENALNLQQPPEQAEIAAVTRMWYYT